MFRYLLTFFYCLIFCNSYCQNKEFQGTYKFVYTRNNIGDSPYGILKIHKCKNGTYLFYLELGRGSPDYNSGSLYGRLIRKKGRLEYIPRDTNDCKLSIVKSGKRITVTTVSGECGFGYGVYADHAFPLKDKINPPYFINMKADTIFFDKTSPEDYLF